MPQSASSFITPGGQVQSGGLVSNTLSAFQRALNWIFQAEGTGYENVPGDLGGPTNSGITQTDFTRWLLGSGQAPRSVSTATRDELNRVYYDLYWNRSPAAGIPAPSKIADPALQLVVFDTAVNPRRGVWQYVKNALDNTTASTSQKVAYILDRRDALYRQRVQEAPGQAKFLQGWLNRTGKLRKILLGGGDPVAAGGFWDNAYSAVAGSASGSGVSGIMDQVLGVGKVLTVNLLGGLFVLLVFYLFWKE